MATKAMVQGRPVRARMRTVKFGDVTVTGPAPSAASVRESVQQSTEALERLVKVFAKPGTTIRPRRGVPLFSLDSDDPDVMIRKLDGKVERGQLVNGEFQPFG